MMNREFISICALCAVLSARANWFYPQMDLELYRLESMKEECRLAGMIASHPGELPELRGSAQFRNRNKDADFTAVGPASVKRDADWIYVNVDGRFRGVGALKSETDGWEAKTFDGVWHPAARYEGGDEPPHLQGLKVFGFEAFKSDRDFLDAGEEVLAYVECKSTSDGWATWEKKPIQVAENFTATISTPHGTLEIKR